MPTLMKPDAGQFYSSSLYNQVNLHGLCDELLDHPASYECVCVRMSASVCVHNVCVSDAMC